jgi:hypothetical protein
MVFSGAWFFPVHGFFRCMVFSGAWFFPVHGFFRCRASFRHERNFNVHFERATILRFPVVLRNIRSRNNITFERRFAQHSFAQQYYVFGAIFARLLTCNT